MRSVSRLLLWATWFLTGFWITDAPGQVGGILQHGTTEYMAAYNEGLCLGHYNGRIVGKARGVTEGTEVGQREGYDSGWESTYQLAYDERYEVYFDEGHTLGLRDAFIAAFWEGFESAELSLSYFHIDSGFGIYNSGGATLTVDYCCGSWNGTNDSGPYLGTYEAVYNHGYSYGYTAGDAEGFKLTYQVAYDAAFQPAFEEGSREGENQGALDGQTNGLADGNLAGSTEGRDAGYDVGYDYRMAGGTRTDGQAYAEWRLFDLYTIDYNAPRAPLSAAIEYGGSDEGPLSVVPEPLVLTLAVAGLIFAFRRRSTN